MINIAKVMRFMADREHRFFTLRDRGFYKKMDDQKYLEKLFNIKFPYKINLDNPKTFNEKLNWLKIHDRKRNYTDLADKYKVKEIVANIIGDEYVVPNIMMCKSIYDIDWEKLPDKFVIKANHDSSGAVICRDKNKLDIDSIKKRYSSIMNTNYFYQGREWPYKNIKPCVLVDTFLDDNTSTEEGTSLRDYKFWCFNGEPCYMYCTVKGSEVYENFYDMSFTPMEINHGFERHFPEFEKPESFDEMKRLAGILAKESKAPFIRIDFFDVNGKVYFGEFTFYDWGGMRPFATYEQDLELGNMIKLPKIK